MSFASMRSARSSTAVSRASIPGSSSFAIACTSMLKLVSPTWPRAKREKTNAVSPDNHPTVTITGV